MLKPSNPLLGWKAELALIGLLLATGALISIAIYVPIDSEYVSAGFWTTVVLTVSATIWLYVTLLNWFELQYLRLPSTWLMLFGLMLFIALAITSHDKPWKRYPSSTEVALLAGLILCSVVSIVINVRRTSVLFGMTLTLIQIFFSIPLVIGAVLALSGETKSSKKRSEKKSSMGNSSSTESDMDRMRMF